MFPELLDYPLTLSYSILYKLTRPKKQALHNVNEKSVTTYKSSYTSLLNNKNYMENDSLAIDNQEDFLRKT